MNKNATFANYGAPKALDASFGASSRCSKETINVSLSFRRGILVEVQRD
jgi:hypothetical protein